MVALSGHKAFPSADFPLLRAWRQVLNHIPLVDPMFLSVLLHTLAG